VTEPAPPTFALTTSRGFPSWLDQVGASLAFTTYQAGKLLFLGLKPDGSVSIFERSFPRAMGLGVSADGRMLLLATQVQLYRFDNVLEPGMTQGIHDAVYAPHQTWITGDLDIHDIGIGPGNRPLFANTLFNCVAAASDGHSFRPVWRPPFISRIAAEDRCHLNGLAMEGTAPRYVTCVSRSDSVDGWRDRRVDGGVVVDVATGKIVVEGLSMPHSPRLHEGRLWLLNSGAGEFGWVDIASGTFNPIAFCPGYARGLAFAGRYAIVGLSRARENRTFQGLPLDDALTRHDTSARTGLLVIDTQTGDTVEWVRIEGVIDELFDIAVLPKVRCPSAIGIKSSEIRRVISIEDQ
jgi:uncharacterized protein (TIGR03032 family)